MVWSVKYHLFCENGIELPYKYAVVFFFFQFTLLLSSDSMNMNNMNMSFCGSNFWWVTMLYTRSFKLYFILRDN